MNQYIIYTHLSNKILIEQGTKVKSKTRSKKTVKLYIQDEIEICKPPIANPIDLSSSTIQSTLQTPSQQSTSHIISDYLGSTPTSEQIRENPFSTPTTTEHLPYWMTQAFTQGEPNVVNGSINVSSDTTLSLPETLSLPSTPSLFQISPTPFPSNFPTNFDARYKENSTNNIYLRFDWDKSVTPPPLFGQHH